MSGGDGLGEQASVQRAWFRAASGYRRALEALGWPMPPCLPGEREACGGLASEHAAAYLGALRALVEFKLEHLHLGVQGEHLAEHAYDDTRAELQALEAAKPCGQGGF